MPPARSTPTIEKRRGFLDFLGFSSFPPILIESPVATSTRESGFDSGALAVSRAEAIWSAGVGVETGIDSGMGAGMGSGVGTGAGADSVAEPMMGPVMTSAASSGLS